MKDNILREKVKDLKRYQNISYKELADLIDITDGSFYNWLKGEYDFSFFRSNILNEMISTLKEPNSKGE